MLCIRWGHGAAVGVVLATLWALSMGRCTDYVNERILTHDCGGECTEARDVCIMMRSCENNNYDWMTCTSERSGACHTACTVSTSLLDDWFQLYIDAGSYKSTQERENELSDPDWQQKLDDMEVDEYVGQGFSVISNDLVQKADMLEFPSQVANVAIIGTRSVAAPRGKVVDLFVPRGFLTKSEHLSQVFLRNLNSGQQLQRSFTQYLPTRLSTLDLLNTLLEELPDDLQEFRRLERLTLKSNYLRGIPREMSLPSLGNLSLADNLLEDFGGDFPQLENLNLTGNALKSLPKAIFGYPNLKYVSVKRNRINALHLTENEYKFLQKIGLAIDIVPSPADCEDVRMLEIERGAVEVCIHQEATTGKPNVSPPTPNDQLVNGEQKANEQTKSSVGLVVGIILGVLLVVLVAAAFLWRKRRQRMSALYDEDDPWQPQRIDFSPLNGGVYHNDFSGNPSEEKVTNPPIALLEIPSPSTTNSDSLLQSLDANLFDLNRLLVSDIHEHVLLGSGRFTEVKLVQYRSAKLASKRLKTPHTSNQLDGFVSMIQFNSHLEHQKIVQFVGVAWSSPDDLQVLFEYMPQGDVRTWLRAQNHGSPSWNDTKLRIAMDVIDVLADMHSLDEPVLHRNLRVSNVLLSDEYDAKLRDFMPPENMQLCRWGPFNMDVRAYVAPEVLIHTSNFTEASDVYAFGIFLTELATSKRWTDNLSSDGQLESSHLRCPSVISETILACLSTDPSSRPRASYLCNSLSSMCNRVNLEDLQEEVTL